MAKRGTSATFLLEPLCDVLKELIIYQVVLIQVTEGNTTSESVKLENKVSEIVAHINGTYGSLEFTPVHHYHHHVQSDELYALLSIADAALITAVRDGMNTTSLEYIMCQQDKHGPLILSEFTGTAGSMSSALMVNPWDYAGVAKAINDALLMSKEEKINRHMVRKTKRFLQRKNESFADFIRSCSNYWITLNHTLPLSGHILL